MNRSKLRSEDLVRLGVHGLISRFSRALLSALGIAVGIASIVAVTGISASSRAQLQQELDSLGTNLLTAAAQTTNGSEGTLPQGAVKRIQRVDGVLAASSTAILSDQNLYRSQHIDKNATGGITAMAADLGLPEVTATDVSKGKWFDQASATLPTVVLGSEAAKRLGIVSPGSQVLVGDRQVTVIGILKPSVLAPELDVAALFGEPFARQVLGMTGGPSTTYQRLEEDKITQSAELIPGTVSPGAPGAVKVSRPSDALAAKQAADQAFTGLLAALAGVALLVGGIGVANTMVISVIERRREIGLRRALGATRVHIALQFLAEALALSVMGAALGAVLGTGVVAAVSGVNGWPIAISASGTVMALGATVLIGAVAGLYPAVKASRVSPSLALSS